MCRLLALVGRNLPDLPRYLDAFVEVSRCDPLLTELRGGSRCEGHGDGWGYVLIGVRSSGRALSAHYRTTLPVYEDPKGVNSLEDLARDVAVGALIVHSRRAAEGSARTWNTHPIHYSWKGFEMWIAHNGLMDSEELSKELGVSKLADTTDTYYLGEYVYRRLRDLSIGELVEALRGAAEYTKTAMNTLIALYDGRRLLVSATSYLSDSYLSRIEKERGSLAVQRALRYYELYTESSNGSHAFFSSSVAEHLGSARAKELKLRRARAIKLELETGRISWRVRKLG